MFSAASALQGFDWIRTIGSKNKFLTAEVAQRSRSDSFERGCNDEFLRRRIVLDAQNIRLAANLAVLDIGLPASGAFIHSGRIPLAAPRTLKTSFHKAIIPHCRPRRHFYEIS